MGGGNINSVFPVGNAVLNILILHFHNAKLAVPLADNQTLDKGLVTTSLQWGRVRPKRSPVIALTLLARWPQEGGSCVVITNEVK
jgi:hypothetical protein